VGSLGEVPEGTPKTRLDWIDGLVLISLCR